MRDLKEPDALLAARSASPDTFYEFATNPANQRARRYVNAEIDRRFGGNTKFDASVRLSRGLVGVAVDYERQGLAIVIDPSKVDKAELQGALNREAALGNRAVPGSTVTPVRVLEGCSTSEDLVEVYQKIRGQKALGGLPYGYSLNPRNSTWEIYTEDHAAAAQEFADQQRGRVTVVPTEWVPQSDDRYNDRQPHWGGARITRRTVGGNCTSSFTVNSQNSAEGQAHVTAGHCWPVGSVIDSGSFYFGNVIRRPNFPLFDTALLNASDQNYDDNLYNGVTSTSSNIDISGVDTPVYTTTSGNRIAGLNVCGNRDAPFDVSLAETYQHVQVNLGVCVATTPTYQAC